MKTPAKRKIRKKDCFKCDFCGKWNLKIGRNGVVKKGLQNLCWFCYTDLYEKEY